VADWQLARFKADPAHRGKVMNQGLWAYSRHPNYFGETLIWWGLFLIALSTPYGWWALISPVVITFLLLKVSGVTLLEKDIVERRPEYREYLETTSAFIPWFPKGGHLSLLGGPGRTGLHPRALLRWGIRGLTGGASPGRLAAGQGGQGELLQEFSGDLRRSPIAVDTQAANVQHYEVPPAFFQKSWESGSNTAAAGGRRGSRPWTPPRRPCWP
jgi:hypothetical protein